MGQVGDLRNASGPHTSTATYDCGWGSWPADAWEFWPPRRNRRRSSITCFARSLACARSARALRRASRAAAPAACRSARSASTLAAARSRDARTLATRAAAAFCCGVHTVGAGMSRDRGGVRSTQRSWGELTWSARRRSSTVMAVDLGWTDSGACRFFGFLSFFFFLFCSAATRQVRARPIRLQPTQQLTLPTAAPSAVGPAERGRRG